MDKKIKIAIYSGNIPSTTFVENLIEGISATNSVFLFGKQSEAYKKSNSNIHVHSYGKNIFRNCLQAFFRTLFLLLKYPNRFSILSNQIRGKKSNYDRVLTWIRIVPILLYLPEIFHIQWAKDLENWMFLKQLNVKIVLSLRGAHINYSPIVDQKLADSYKKNFLQVDAFHAVSSAIAIETQKYGAKQEKIKVIHSIISEETFNRFQLPNCVEKEGLKIISVGRHHWKKDYASALDACKILKDRKILFKYTIIAHGIVPEELLFKRDKLDLLSEVVFLEGLPHLEVLNLMQQNDVLLLSSIEEGIANVVLEAMAIGIPVISTDCGGMNEVINSGEHGELVDVLSPILIAKAMENRNNISNEKIKQETRNASTFIKEHFSEEKILKEFNDLYNNIYVEASSIIINKLD